MPPTNDTNRDQLIFVLGEIRGQLTEMNAALSRIEERQTGLETRIRALENSHAKVIGAAGVLATLGSVIVQWVMR